MDRVGRIMAPECEPFYLNSDVESEDGRRNGHTAEMVSTWSEHWDSDCQSLVEFHSIELTPKWVSFIRQGKLLKYGFILI